MLSCADAVVEVTNRDDASAMIAADKKDFLSGLADHVEHPASTEDKHLQHSERCIIHQLHRLHNSLWGEEAAVGELYATLKLSKHSSLLCPLTEECESIAKTTTRVVGPPPPETESSKTNFLQPIEDVAKQLASENRSLGWWRRLQALVVVLHCWHLDFLVHHCWDSTLSQPCCGSDQEAQEKVFVALLDMFVLHPPPAPALRDWLSARRAMSWWAIGTAIGGNVMKRLYGGALAKAKSNNNVAAKQAAHRRDHRGDVLADLGSKENHMTEIIAARKSKVLRLVNNEFSAWMFYGCLVVSSFSGLLLLRLMRSDGLDKKSRGNLRKGGRGGVKKRSEVLTSNDILGSESLLAQLCQSYRDLLQGWGPQSSWGGLQMFGMHTFQSLKLSQKLRGFTQKAGAQAHRRFVVYFDKPPYTLYAFLDPLATDERREQARRQLLRKCCCCYWFCCKYLTLIGGAQHIESPLGLAVLSMLFKCIRWHAAVVERTHSLHRHLLLHQGRGMRWPRHLASRHYVHTMWWHSMLSQQEGESTDIVHRLLKVLDPVARGQATNKRMIEIAECALHGKRSKRKISHGNPKWSYQNDMERQEKMLVGRKLTKLVADTVQKQALFEWDEVCSRSL